MTFLFQPDKFQLLYKDYHKWDIGTLDPPTRFPLNKSSKRHVDSECDEVAMVFVSRLHIWC